MGSYVVTIKERRLNANTMDSIFAAVLSDLGTDRHTKKASIAIDLQEVTFIDPYGMTCLWALAHVLRDYYNSVGFNLPSDIDVQQYMLRIGFFELMAEEHFAIDHVAESRLSTTRHESEVLLELTRISQGADVIAITGTILDRVASILQRQLGYTRTDINAFSTALSEACQNVCDHSGAVGIAAVQTYTRHGNRHVSIAVVDVGRGIRASLSDRYHDARNWDHGTAIAKALQKDYSRLPDRGLGLHVIQRIVDDYGGSMHIRSGDARLHMGQRTLIYPSSEFPGTQLCFNLSEKRIK